MKSIILALAVGALTTFSAMMYFENEKLTEENRRLSTISANVQRTNREFEMSLISCRHTVDGFVSRSQETIARRLLTDMSRFKPLPIHTSGVNDGHVFLQAEQ